MKKYSFLTESVGRQLVGASKFASRKQVAQQILQQYPNPNLLANQLYQMANQTFGKEKETLLNLYFKCKACNNSNYPQFVNSIAGFSAIWKYIGVAAGSTAAIGAANYVIGHMANNRSDNPNYTIADGLEKTADDAIRDTKTAIKKIPGAGYIKNIPGVSKISSQINGKNLRRAINYIPQRLNAAYSQKVNSNFVQNSGQ